MFEEVVGSGLRKSEVNRNEKINIYSGKVFRSEWGLEKETSPRSRGDVKTTHTKYVKNLLLTIARTNPVLFILR